MPPQPQFALTPLHAGERGAAVAALAESFMADPLFGWLHAVPERRRLWLRGFMGVSLDVALPCGHVYRLADAPDGVISLLAPDDWPPPATALLGAVARVVASSLCARMRREAIAAALHAYRRIDQLHPAGAAWYVATLGLHPRRQGRGEGGRLLGAACAAIDAVGGNLYLETSNRANLGFYGRFGFAVEYEIGLPHGAPPVWTMRRPPNAVAS